MPGSCFPGVVLSWFCADPRGVPLALSGIPDLGLLVIKILAVAGAASLGWSGSGFLLTRLTRSLVWRKPPTAAVVVVRGLGSATCGILVFWWLFLASGEGGMGGGPGLWPFGGSGSAQVADKKDPSSARTSAPDAAKQKDPTPSLTSPGRSVRVTMLGGKRVDGQKFYLVGRDPTPLTLADVERVVSAAAADGEAVKLLEVRLYRDSVDRENPAVTLLKRWAEGRGMTVALSFPPADLPDPGSAGPETAP